jgi:hypothetical protein
MVPVVSGPVLCAPEENAPTENAPEGPAGREALWRGGVSEPMRGRPERRSPEVGAERSPAAGERRSEGAAERARAEVRGLLMKKSGVLSVG